MITVSSDHHTFVVTMSKSPWRKVIRNEQRVYYWIVLWEGGCWLAYLAKGSRISKFIYISLDTRITKHRSSICRKWQLNSCIQKVPVTVSDGRGTVLASEDTEMRETTVSALPVYGETNKTRRQLYYNMGRAVIRLHKNTSLRIPEWIF